MKNPLKKLKELKNKVPSPSDLAKIGGDTKQQLVEQTKLMVRWAAATERQADQMERIAQSLEAIAKRK